MLKLCSLGDMTEKKLPTLLNLIKLQLMLKIITARKRSFGAGNVFTDVCLSTGGGGM